MAKLNKHTGIVALEPGEELGEDSATQIAQNIAERVVRHDVTRRLHQAGIKSVYTIALNDFAAAHLAESIRLYLAYYGVGEDTHGTGPTTVPDSEWWKDYIDDDGNVVHPASGEIVPGKE